MGRYVWKTPSGGYGFYWTYCFAGYIPHRRAYYNYYNPPFYWLGPTCMDTRQSRMGSLDQLSDGRALGSAHVTVVYDLETCVYLDAAEGAGIFSIITIPWQGALGTYPIWPKPCVDDSDYIYVAASQNGGPYAYWNMSTDEGVTWRGWDSTLAGIVLNPINYDYGGSESWTQYRNKIALINNTGDENYAIVCWQSSDHGTTWYYDTVYCLQTTPGDSVWGFVWNSAVYDNNGYLHVVFTAIDTAQGSGGSLGSGWRSQIRHWSGITDQNSIVTSGWWTLNPGPGASHPTVSECQIAIDRETGTLYCTWCQADSGDVAYNGYTNLEIYIAHSTDNGTTWTGHCNITNSHAPGAWSGVCEHDWWQSIAETTNNDTVYVFYMNDKDPGSSVRGEGLPTYNPMLFYPYYYPVAIDEHKVEKLNDFTLLSTPNPVSQNLNISYALTQSCNVSLKLCSIDGRLVKTIYDGHRKAGLHKENVDCTGMGNGIYFVILKTATGKESCSVVVIH
jgi:hypothetical protein